MNRLLTDALLTSSLVVVRAPDAFGKTTAVAGWAVSDHPHGVVVWVDARAPGESAASLWREILSGAALLLDPPAGGRPGPAEEVLALLEKKVPPLDAFRGLASALLPDIPRGVLVLDGVPAALPDGFLDTLIALLRRYEGLRVIITTVHDLHLETTPAGMQLDARSIGARELRLTRKEIRSSLGGELPGLDAGKVAAHTNGHPALVRAVIAARRFNQSASDVRRAVNDYIRAGLGRSEVAVRHRDFLLRTSVAKSLTVGLAADLSGIRDPRPVLRELADRSYIQRRRRRAGDLYSYAKTLRRALREELEERHPELVAALTRIMADHHLASGQPLKALAAAAGIGDLDLAEVITRDHQVELRTLYAGETRRVLAGIPDASLAGHPMLALTVAMIRKGTDRDPTRTAELMDLALAAAEDAGRGTPLVDRAAALLARMVALRVSCEWKEALKAADAAEMLFSSAAISDRWNTRSLAVAVYIQAAVTHLLQASYDRSEALLYRALAIAMEEQMTGALQKAAGLLALTHAATGRVITAETVLSQAPEPPPAGTAGSDFSAAPYRLAAAIVAMEADNYTEASAQLDLAGDGVWFGEFWPYAMIIRISLDVVMDAGRPDLDEPERALTRADLPCPSDQLRASLVAAVSTAHLAAGNAGRAVAVLQGMDARNAMVALPLARAALATGHNARAEALLSGVRNAGLNERRTVEMMMLRAIVHERAGRSREASDITHSGLRIMQRTGLGATMLMIPESAVYTQTVEEVLERPPGQVISGALTMAQLTAREQVVLRALAEHSNAPEAARALVVSVNTIKAQSRSIYRKLGVTNLQSALAVAQLQGLLPPL